MNFTITKDKDIVRKCQKNLGDKSWPEFMQHDYIVEKYWPNLYERFSTFQFAVFDSDELVGAGNTIPLKWNKSFHVLPDTGVDWAIEKGNTDWEANVDFNLLIAMQILINKNYRGKGISAEMVKVMKQVASENNIQHIALPVRPTFKHKYPLIPMNEYINWKREDGQCFDPWLRVHLKLGGETIGVCEKSMTIKGNIEAWKRWTGMEFPGPGNHIIDGALVPLKIDIIRNVGEYIEPNVWMIHHVQ